MDTRVRWVGIGIKIGIGIGIKIGFNKHLKQNTWVDACVCACVCTHLRDYNIGGFFLRGLVRQRQLLHVAKQVVRAVQRGQQQQ